MFQQPQTKIKSELKMFIAMAVEFSNQIKSKRIEFAFFFAFLLRFICFVFLLTCQ